MKKYNGNRARNFLLGFCFLISLGLFAGESPSQPARRDLFAVVPADDAYADSVYFYLSFFEERLRRILGPALDTTVTVFIAANEDQFLHLVGRTFPDWGAAAALTEEMRIVIKSPKSMRVGKSFRELIGHELTHIMLHRAAGGRPLPRWFHEGLAMRVSGEWHIAQDILVARAAWTGNLIHLHRLRGLSGFRGAQASLAYTESYLAVSGLLKKKDPTLIADLLSLYRETGDFYGSWEKVVGKPYDIWIADWYRETSKRYHFFLFIFDEQVFWVIVSLAFVLLFIMKRRQAARIRRRWELEEKLRPPDDSYKRYFDGYYDQENQV